MENNLSGPKTKKVLPYLNKSTLIRRNQRKKMAPLPERSFLNNMITINYCKMRYMLDWD
jgi:hypothetical protein